MLEEEGQLFDTGLRNVCLKLVLGCKKVNNDIPELHANITVFHMYSDIFGQVLGPESGKSAYNSRRKT